MLSSATNFLPNASAITGTSDSEVLVEPKEEAYRAQYEKTILVLTNAKAYSERIAAVVEAKCEKTILVITQARADSERQNVRYYRSLNDIVASKNVELMDLQGRLALRFVVEEFERKVTNEEVVKMKMLLKEKTKTPPSTREATWEVILRSNTNTLGTYLIGENRALTDEEIKRWVTAVKDLYRVASKYIHNYSADKVSINTVWLTVDASKLAVGICETLPVKFHVMDGGNWVGVEEESADPAKIVYTFV